MSDSAWAILLHTIASSSGPLQRAAAERVVAREADFPDDDVYVMDLARVVDRAEALAWARLILDPSDCTIDVLLDREDR